MDFMCVIQSKQEQHQRESRRIFSAKKTPEQPNSRWKALKWANKRNYSDLPNENEWMRMQEEVSERRFQLRLQVQQVFPHLPHQLKTESLEPLTVFLQHSSKAVAKKRKKKFRIFS